MGIYTSAFLNESTVELDLTQIEESAYEPTLEGGFMIAMEAEQNYNEIMKSIAIYELNYMDQNGTEVVYEAVDVRGFFGKVKDFFMNLLKKVAALFKSFLAKFNSWTMKDKEFVKKYQKQILSTQRDTKNFEYKGYEFTNLDKWNPDSVKGAANSVINDEVGITIATAKNLKANTDLDAGTMTKIKKAVGENKEDIQEKLRGAAIYGEKNKPVSASDFAKEISEYFRNNESSRTTITGVIPSDQLGIISKSEKDKKTAETAFKNYKKATDEIIKELNAVEKALTSGLGDSENKDRGTQIGESLTVVNAAISFTKDSMSYIQTVNSGLLSALKDRNRQARAICVKLATTKTGDNDKTKLATESAGFTHFLDGVVLR